MMMVMVCGERPVRRAISAFGQALVAADQGEDETLVVEPDAGLVGAAGEVDREDAIGAGGAPAAAASGRFLHGIPAPSLRRRDHAVPEHLVIVGLFPRRRFQPRARRGTTMVSGPAAVNK